MTELPWTEQRLSAPCIFCDGIIVEKKGESECRQCKKRCHFLDTCGQCVLDADGIPTAVTCYKCEPKVSAASNNVKVCQQFMYCDKCENI